MFLKKRLIQHSFLNKFPKILYLHTVQGSKILQKFKYIIPKGLVLDALLRYRISVSFWVLALDHDLQIVTDAIGTVSVKDPAGTKVALWDQISLDEGRIFSTSILPPNQK